MGHHPLIVTPLAAALGAAIGYGVGQMCYGVTLAVIATIAHFCHDSIQPQGLHWLWPFTWRRHRLTLTGFKEVPENVWLPIMLAKDRARSTTSDEFTSRSSPVSWAHVAAWLVAFALIPMLVD